MTDLQIPSNPRQLAALVKQGEGPTLEFKRSTGELKEGMQTLCAFLDRSGGMVLFGKKFMPDYPQCELRMARFRGTDKTEFLDQRNV
ncbi:MAG: hypothetical protein FJ278_02220, partial [Planctomycetes bacterium]|nr:hypothetical protein [Planctomycetota bacterium]